MTPDILGAYIRYILVHVFKLKKYELNDKDREYEQDFKIGLIIYFVLGVLFLLIANMFYQ